VSRRSVMPLLLGTFILRINTGAGAIILGLFLAHLAHQEHGHHAVNSLQVGLLAVAFFITELTLAPFMGALSDHLGRRTFLIAGPLLGLLITTLLPFTPIEHPLPYLLSLQVLSGLSSAIMNPAVLGYLADFTSRDQARRTRTMGLYELVTTGGIATGVVLAGFAWDHFGRLAFGMLALFYFIVAVCMLLSPIVNQVIDRGKVDMLVTRYVRIVRTPRLFIFIPAWISINALVGVWVGSQLTFLLSSPRHDPHQLLMGSLSGPGGGSRLSLILGAYVLFFGLCLLFWSFFLRHVPRLFLMLASVSGVYLVCIALAILNHGGLGNALLLVICLLIFLLGIFAESSFAPSALSYLAEISEDFAKDRGLLMGLYTIFLGLGQLLGNGLGGVFAQRWGFDGLIYLTALLASVALVSLLSLFRWEKKTV
jgi:MFS family permease